MCLRKNNFYKNLLNSTIKKIRKDLETVNHEGEIPFLERYLITAADKSIKFSEAIICLCEHNYANESIPILRSLIEHSINMRWITTKEPEKRAKEYMNNDDIKKGFGRPWTNLKLDQRMIEVGFKDKDYFDFCVKYTYSHAHVNASSLDWGITIKEIKNDRWIGEPLFATAIQMLGHTMKALNSHYKDKFKDYNKIWNQIKVDKNVREKVNNAIKLNNL